MLTPAKKETNTQPHWLDFCLFSCSYTRQNKILFWRDPHASIESVKSKVQDLIILINILFSKGLDI